MTDQTKTELQNPQSTGEIQSGQVPVQTFDIHDILDKHPKKTSTFNQYRTKLIIICALFLLMLTIFSALSVISQKSQNNQQVNENNLVDSGQNNPSPSPQSPESKIRQEITTFGDLTNSIGKNFDQVTAPKIDVTITVN